MLKSLRNFQSYVEDRMTLKQQVGVATAALCAVIILVLASVAAAISERQAQAAASVRLSDIAYTFADRLDRSLTQRMSTLSLLTSLPPLQGLWSENNPSARHVLDETREYITGASWLGYATADGIVRAASGGLLEGKSVMERPWFRAGLAGPTFGDVHEAKLLAPLLGPSPDGQPYRFVDVATPVVGANGNPVGVLGLHISWSWFDGIRKALIQGQTGVPSLDIWIVSKTGEILLGGEGAAATTPDALAAMAKAGRGSYTTGGGRDEQLVSFARLETVHQLGWFVVARQPATVAFAAAQTLVVTIVTIGALVTLLAFAGALMIAGRVSRPLRRLTAKADRIGRDSTDMLPRVRGSQEVVHLSSALRSLLLRIGKARQETADLETRAADQHRRLESDIAALRTMVDVDPLSGIPNRRGFLTFAEDAMAHFRRYGRPFAIFMIDIDHFKRVNDTHGHATGDAAIRSVAATIESAIRPSDKAGRFGGEEFVVLMREIELTTIEEAGERIRAAVATTPVAVNGASLAVTVSIGVAVVSPADRDIQDIIERADLALYSAKGAGRNRTVFAATPAEEARLSA
ncbi:MAG TPA: sensor domain-containing diguanylate cyclase [Bauldia sp.]|nr:sensor domain-containing diguanylate cyclase [Bauldia sp.]